MIQCLYSTTSIDNNGGETWPKFTFYDCLKVSDRHRIQVYTAQEIAASLHQGRQKIHFPSTNHLDHDTTLEHQSLKPS